MTIRNRFAIVFLLACATLRLSAADAQTPPRPALDAEAIAAVESGLIATDAPPAFVESPPAVEAPADAETGETGGGLTLFGKKLLPKFGKTDEEKARDEAERREKERRIAQEQQAHEKQRDLLAQQEARLAERRQRKVVYRLQDVLNTIDRDAEALAAQAAQRRQELDQLRLRRTALDQTLMQQRSLAYPDPRELLSAEQTLINHNERMVLLNLQIDYWDTLNVLAAEANRIDGIVKALPATPRPTLRRIIDKKRLAAEEERQLFELLVTINEIEIQQTELLAALEILEARFVTLDDEIRLLDEKVALTRSRNDRRALELAELRRDLLGQRIGILREQAASLRNTIETSEAIESLYRIYLEVLHDDFAKLLERYKRSIMVPLSIIAALILVYIAISRLVMPYVYKRDRLFIARRLGVTSWSCSS